MEVIMTKSYLLFIVLLAPLLLLAEVLEVSHDTSFPFQLIQDAILSAGEGDTILVYPGIYYENISFEGKHNITLISSEGESNTVIDGINGNRGCISLMNGEENILISGFEVRNGNDAEDEGLADGGIYIDAATNILLRNLIIHHNYSLLGGGLYINNSDYIALSNLTIRNNVATLMGGGIYQNENSGLQYDLFNRCSVYDNYSVRAMDIYSRDVCDIYLESFSYPETENNNAYVQEYSTGETGAAHFNTRNALHTYIASDVYLSPDGDDSNDGLTPETALKSAWVAFSRMPVASNQPRTAHFAAGVFDNKVNGLDVGIFVPDNTHIQGAGKEMTRIEISSYNNRSYGMYFQDEAEDIKVSDLTLSYTSGRAVVSYNAWQVVLENVSFEDCSYIRSAFVGISGDNTELTMKNVSFRNLNDTYDPGVLLNFNGKTLRLDSCDFSDNQMTNYVNGSNYGLFSAVISDSLIVKNSIFRNNDHNAEYGSIMVRENTSENNTTAIWDNNLYVGNVAHCSNTFNFITDNVYIYNSTFSNNVVYGQGQTFIRVQAQNNLNIINSIFNGNSGSYEELVATAEVMNIDYCTFNRQYTLYNLDDSQLGDNNFINVLLSLNEGDPAYLDYYFYNETNATNPCQPIDHGTTNPADFYQGYVLPEFDVLGNPRVYNDIIDIGAIEYRNPIANDEQVIIPSLNLSCAPNPFNPTTTISFDTPLSGMTELIVYNVKGQRINTLVNERLNAGSNKVVWKGIDDKGHSVGSGVYFLRLTTNQECKTFKAVMLK
jgi:hypothetical protein